MTNEKEPKNTDIVWKHRIKAKVIDSPAIIRGPPKTVPMNDSFLDYLEFRMNQKPTLLERLFGKRL